MQPNEYSVDTLHKTFSYALAYAKVFGENSYGVRACTAIKSFKKDKKYFSNMDQHELYDYCKTF